MNTDVKNFFQCTDSRRPAPFPLVLLMLLLIIDITFERVGMDLVGPLPKSARGHKHILIIADYSTQYPEAVPLWKATSKYIA